MKYSGLVPKEGSTLVIRNDYTNLLKRINHDSHERAWEILYNFTSKNSQRAYLSDLRYWQGWLIATGFNFQENISKKEVFSFIIQHAEGLHHKIEKVLKKKGLKNSVGNHKITTIKRRVSSLSTFLSNAELPNPCRDQSTIQLLHKLTKLHGQVKHQSAKAITKDILDNMINVMKNRPIDIRNKALLYFAWSSGGRRRSEIVSARIENLYKLPDGNFIYTLPHSKNDQEGKGHKVPLKGKAACAMQAWLDYAKIDEGPIFRSMPGRIHITNNGIGENEIYWLIKSLVKKAGYNEKDFSPHSLRSGFVTSCGRKSIPLGDVMQMTTHRRVESVLRYYVAGDVVNNLASNLAD